MLCECKSEFIPIPIHDGSDDDNDDDDNINSVQLVGSTAREMTGPNEIGTYCMCRVPCSRMYVFVCVIVNVAHNGI